MSYLLCATKVLFSCDQNYINTLFFKFIFDSYLFIYYIRMHITCWYQSVPACKKKERIQILDKG